MTKIADLKAKLAIDEHALEVGLREHPQLVYEIGMALAEAISERDEAKEKLGQVEAEVEKEIREEASNNDEKVTDKSVDAQKKTDIRVVKANETFLAKKYDAAQLQVLSDAFSQRSYALSKLVDLYIANYYSNIEKKGADNKQADVRTVQAGRVREARRQRVTV